MIIKEGYVNFYSDPSDFPTSGNSLNVSDGQLQIVTDGNVTAFGGSESFSIRLNESIVSNVSVKVSKIVSSYSQLPNPSTKKGELYALLDTSLYKSNGKKWTFIPGTGPMVDLFALPIFTVGVNGQYVTDGVADEVQINQAVAAANAVGGGIVHLLPGIFNLSTPAFSQYNNVYFKGSGVDVTILRAAANFVSIGAPTTVYGVLGFAPVSASITNFGVFGGLTIDRATSGVDGNCLTAQKKSGTDSMELVNGFFADVKILGGGGYTQGPYEVWMQGVTGGAMFGLNIDGFTPPVQANVYDHVGIEFQGGTDVFAFNNTIKNVGTALAAFTVVEHTRSLQNCHIFNNIVDNCKDFISTDTSYNSTTNSETGTVFGPNNVFDLFIHNNVGTTIKQKGILFTFAVGSLTRPPQANNVNIYNNTCNMASSAQGRYTTQQGILVTNTDSSASVNSMNASDFNIDNNGIYGCAPGASGNIISLLTVKNISLNGNYTKTAQADFGAYNVSGLLLNKCVNINITNHKIDGATLYGMLLQGVYDSNFENITVNNWNLNNIGVNAIKLDTIANKNLRFVNIVGKSTSPTNEILDLGSSANDNVTYENIKYSDGNRPVSGTTPIVKINAGATNLVNTNNYPIKKFTVSAAATYTLTNLAITSGSFIELQQITGSTPVVIGQVVCTDGQAVITFGASNSETFKYRIIN